MNRMLLIFGGSTLIYAALATMMGVLPGLWLSNIPPGPGVEPLTEVQAQGRDVYVAEGCQYCHTQQVRPVPGDSIFGRPSAPGDYAYQTPQLLGSERNGPDLTNVGARQPSEIWQFIHLYEPRAVVPQSIMPAYPWLFQVVDKAPEGVAPVPVPADYAPADGVVIPNDRAKALVAYLISLKQAPFPTEAQAGEAAPAAASPGQSMAAPGFDKEAGATLYANHCAACHGPEGKGVPGAFPPLAGDEVVNAADPREHIATVLNGLEGKTIGGQSYSAQMPAFGSQLSDEEIANIIDHERTSWGNTGAIITAADVVAVRGNQPPITTTPSPSAAASPAAPTPPASTVTAQPAFDAAGGATLYADNCAACHGEEGKGVPGAFPPLAGDPVVNATDPTEHIHTVLNGLSGKAIGGTEYDAAMPPFSQLTDQQIADIIGHERTSWGNKAPVVSAEQVAAERAKK